MTIGLARSGRTVPAGYYDNVVKFVRENADKNERLDRNKVTENARVILALTAIGKDVTNVDGHNLLKGLDSMSYIKTQGINGPIFTLIALDSHNYPTSGDVTREKLIETILGAALEDGGWTLSGTKADPDMTAMAIQALAPYYKTNETVKAAVDKALEALSALQRNDGGFGSWGTVNSESCAQVIVALTALGIDPTADSRFVKNGLTVLDALAGFYVTGGGFYHTKGESKVNGMATEQGYYALAAYYRFANAQTRLYDMTDVAIQTGDSNTPATGDTGVLVWVIALPVTALAAAFVLKRKEREE
ncbi:MAG: prenyltransferase/squalene oxidase repeat-containing protein [Oscillospiraceae bacterium]